MLITPSKIYEDFKNNILDKLSAVNILISLIENSKNNIIRTESIEIIEKIGYKDEKIFNILENLLISDLNTKVRTAAANAIKNNFLHKALSPMIWAIQNESSISCLKIINKCIIKIIITLVEQENKINKSLLIKEIENITDYKFRDNINDLIENGKLEAFSYKELTQILIDHIAISLLKKQFRKIKFELENGILKKLDLRFRYLNITSERILSNSPFIIPTIGGDNFIFEFGTSFPFNSIKELHLNYNSLNAIPNWIKSLSQLESLTIYGNKLKNLPNWIGSLLNLKKLSLSNNNLTVLPESLKKLNSLEYLSLSGNNLKHLPDWFGTYRSLKILGLDNNNIISLPKSLESLTSLKKLYLGNNNLKNLPKIFGSLSLLKSLWLEKNYLKTLPESIGELSSLEYLCLNDNLLICLPESIGSLKSLKYLHVNNNNLSKIPESIGLLPSLKELWLKGNNIKDLPESVKKLEKNGLLIYK